MSENLVLFPRAKTHYVLDTWPVMEWLKGRLPVADLFDALIERAEQDEIILWMSMMNVGEVYYNSAREWGLERAEGILDRLRMLPIILVTVSDDEVLSAAQLKIKPGISYADAFAATLGIRIDCQVITGDKDFRELEERGVLRVEWWGA